MGVYLQNVDMAKFAEEAYEMGYKEGYERGIEIGRLESTAKTYKEALLERMLIAARDTGYEEGLKTGTLASNGGAYSEGLRDGAAECWDWCGKYIPAKEDGGAIPVADLQAIFDVTNFGEIFKKYRFSKAKEIVRAYEGRISQVRVGDEVELAGKKVLVTRIPEDDPQRIYYIDASGRTYANNAYAEFKKTGRHFPIEDLLGQMEVPKE